jgi:tetratricopeptide (TPR) repeat protein
MTTPSTSAKFNAAIQFERNADFTSALSEYISILKIDPSFRRAYVNLGSLYSRMNKFTEAMKCYEAALSLGLDDITYFNMGCVLYKMGNYTESLSSLERSISINNNFALSKLVAGLCHSRLNRLAEAETSFSKVLQIWPENRVAMTALAIIYYNTERFSLSLKLLNWLLKIDAENIKMRELKSEILLKLGQHDKSANEIKQILKKSEGYRYFDEFVKSVPVETFTDKYGTLDEKIKKLNDKIYDDSNNFISLSLCHLLNGDTDSAIDYLYKFKKKSIN